MQVCLNLNVGAQLPYSVSPYGIGGIGGDFRDSGYFLSEFGAIKTPGPFDERRNM